MPELKLKSNWGRPMEPVLPMDRPPAGLINTIYPLPKSKAARLKAVTEARLSRGDRVIQATVGRFVVYAVAWARANGRKYSIKPLKMGWQFELED